MGHWLAHILAALLVDRLGKLGRAASDELGQPAERVTVLYHDRWQVEIGFKPLKTLGRLDELPSADPVLANVVADASDRRGFDRRSRQ
jgi:IS4 transposase